MFGKSYQSHEVGAGWVDPRRLGERLSGAVRGLASNQSSPGWIGPMAVSLVLLSWWMNLPVRDVVLWLGRTCAALFR